MSKNQSDPTIIFTTALLGILLAIIYFFVEVVVWLIKQIKTRWN